MVDVNHKWLTFIIERINSLFASYFFLSLSFHSFCRLTTQFAVRVYGALPKASVPPFRIMLGTCALGVSLVMAGFVYQNFWTGDEKEEEEETAE